MEYTVVGEEKLLLEHRGYSCVARRYNDGRWGFGDNPDHDKVTPETDKWGFFWFADNEEEAHARFAKAIDDLIEYNEYCKIREEWLNDTDFKSVSAILNIQPGIFKKRVESGQFDMNLLDKTPGGEYEVPLYYVTKAWDTILKNSMQLFAYKVGPEEEDDVELEDYFDTICEYEGTRTRWEAIEDNDLMKEYWKKYFNIDINALEIDFSQFSKNIYPNVDKDKDYEHFISCPNGATDWMFYHVTIPEEDRIFHECVSYLMELVPYMSSWYANEDKPKPSLKRIKELSVAFREKYPDSLNYRNNKQ